MSSIENKQNYFFEEAKDMFDLERLKSDLQEYEEITDAPWQYFLGILAGNSQKQIAEKFQKEEKTVKQSLTQRLKPHILRLLNLPEDQRIRWATIPQKLLDAGYGVDQEHDQPKFYPTLSLENFKQVLEDKIKKLTANGLLGDSYFDTESLYVPLGLVERKQKPRHGDIRPEHGSDFYRPNDSEITRQFTGDQFLDEVLTNGNSPKSQGKRLAIIWEPGSGKTTRLQQIARWLFKQNTDNRVIWVSLAELKEKTLEEYLLTDWLRDAHKQIDVTKNQKEKLADEFNRGNVWLLLDGIDEMGSSGLSLFDKLPAWIKSAKIIVTCRLNVWDGSPRALSDFDVYRNLDFSDEQQQKFAIKFLKNDNDSQGLIEALNQPGKERINDLVKNPLRLTLLCHWWQENQGSLPDTKADLYEKFVETYYGWKKISETEISDSKKKELEKALGRLAIQGLDRDKFHFRFTKKQINKVLGEADEGFFKLAIKLGWLNEVGLAEETSEKIYAFLHPSFQEYFAALAIESFDFFFLHHPEEINKGTYKIFHKKWQEVIEYWFCRSDIPQKTKITSLNNLLNFKDSCKPFYFYYHAYFVAFKIMTLCNLDDLNLQDKVFKKLISWLLNDVHVDGSIICSVIRNSAAKVIISNSYEYVKSYLFKLFNESLDDEFRQLELSEILLELGFIDDKIVNFLHKLYGYQNSDKDCYIYDGDLQRETLISRKASFLLESFCRERKDTQLILISCWEKNLVSNHDSVYWAQEILRLDPEHELSQKRLSEWPYPIPEFKIPYIESTCDSFVKAYCLNNEQLVLNEFYSLQRNYEVFCEAEKRDNSFLKSNRRNNDYHWTEYKALVLSCFRRDDIRDGLALILGLHFRHAVIAVYHDHNFPDFPEFATNEDILIFQEFDPEYEDCIKDAIFAAKMLNLSDKSDENTLSVVFDIYNSLSTQRQQLGENEELLLLELLFHLALNCTNNYQYYYKILTKLTSQMKSLSWESVQYSETDYFDWEANQYRIRELIKDVCTKHPAYLYDTVATLSEKISYFDEAKVQRLPDSLQEYQIFIYSILWECSEKMPYESFYNSFCKNNHLENINKLDSVNEVNNKIDDLVVKTENLNKIIDQAILLKRFRKRLINAIPTEVKPQIQALINDQQQTNETSIDFLIDQIEDILLALKNELQVEKLDLFLDNKNPSQLLLDLRDKFSDLVNIDWNR